jgi:tubulin polyglutamylase TTLL6/13
MSRANPSLVAQAEAGNERDRISVNLTFTKQALVHAACQQMGYAETSSYTDCLLFWYQNARSAAIASTLSLWQFANHFGASFVVCNKVELARRFEAMRAVLPLIYHFHPRNFIFPEELRVFEDYVRHEGENQTFIVKPNERGAGYGIKLVQGFEGLQRYKESAVCQEYISPFLLNRLKFDLRVYVLVTSVDPLRVYIHRENMVRFCTEKYVPPDRSNLGRKFCHLTNYSVNKDNPKFVANTGDNEGSAHKRSTTSVFAQMAEDGVDVVGLQAKIDKVVQLTMLAMQQEYIDNYRRTVKTQDERSRLFEILGFDILIDEQLNPWLIEVNNNTSLKGGSPLDEELKLSVIKGALTIVHLKRSFKAKVMARQRGRGPASLFNGRKESERSQTTNWRQILPVEESHPDYRLFQTVSQHVLGSQ